MNDNNNNYDFYFWLSVIADIVGLINYELLLEDASNGDLLQELQQQDKVLDEQTHTYLEKIVEQNNKILEILERRNLNEQND